MKEVVCTAANLMAVPDKECAARAMVEVIIAVSEPCYQFDRGGTLRGERAMETIRFHCSPASLRELAESLTEWADEAEAFIAGIRTGKPTEGDGK